MPWSRVKLRLPLLAAPVLLAVLLIGFQNCGQSFSSKVHSAASQSGATPEIPAGTTLNSPNGPVITTGLQNKTSFNSPAGVEAAIDVQDPNGVLFRWTVNGTILPDNGPKITLMNSGQFDVTAEVFNNAGGISKSRAIYKISAYTLDGGQLFYNKTNLVPNVDIATVKPLGLQYAADQNRVFRSLSSLATTNALTAEELGPAYMRVNGFAYYGLTPIAGAVGADLTIVNPVGIAKDKTKIFCGAQEAVGADPAGFTLPFKGAVNLAVDGGDLYLGCVKSTTYSGAGFAAIKNAYTNTDGSAGFFKTGGKYFRFSGTSSNPLQAPTLYELPFANPVEAGLRMVTIGGLSLISDGVSYAATSNGQAIPVTNVNVPTLQQIGGDGSGIFKDNNSVYEFDHGVFTAIPGATPATFKIVGGTNPLIFTDGARVWLDSSIYPIKQISGVDPASLIYLGISGNGGIFADKSDAYVADSTGLYGMQISNPLTIKPLAGAYFVYDQTRLFYVPFHSPARQVPGVTPATFKVHTVDVIANGTQLLFDDTVIAGARGDLLTKIDQSDYWKDTGRIYNINIFGVYPLTTRVASFRFFDAKVSDEYATDGVTVWYQEKAIPDAQVASFKVLSLREAEDALRTYVYERGTPK